jgi:hypothetical protein
MSEAVLTPVSAANALTSSGRERSLRRSRSRRSHRLRLPRVPRTRAAEGCDVLQVGYDQVIDHLARCARIGKTHDVGRSRLPEDAGCRRRECRRLIEVGGRGAVSAAGPDTQHGLRVSWLHEAHPLKNARHRHRRTAGLAGDVRHRWGLRIACSIMLRFQDSAASVTDASTLLRGKVAAAPVLGLRAGTRLPGSRGGESGHRNSGKEPLPLRPLLLSVRGSPMPPRRWRGLDS